MSLWTTPVDQIDFPLVDAFLKGKPNEGVRLDFKAQVPKELAKVIAAFANTIGGIIILGVEENSLNEPVWPPNSTKLHILQDDVKNPRDQITNMANDAIYPPVNVQVSRLIPNTYARGRFLIVIRVDESKGAPHAIEKNQQVFYVEKTGISTDRFTLADMDRIERMILRRRTIEDQRDHIVDEGQPRARSHVGAGGGCSVGTARLSFHCGRNLPIPAIPLGVDRVGHPHDDRAVFPILGWRGRQPSDIGAGRRSHARSL